MISEFRNHPLTDFSKEEYRNGMREALKSVEQQFDRVYPLYIGGESIETGDL